MTTAACASRHLHKNRVETSYTLSARRCPDYKTMLEDYAYKPGQLPDERCAISPRWANELVGSGTTQEGGSRHESENMKTREWHLDLTEIALGTRDDKGQTSADLRPGQSESC